MFTVHVCMHTHILNVNIAQMRYKTKEYKLMHMCKYYSLPLLLYLCIMSTCIIILYILCCVHVCIVAALLLL